MIWLVLDAFDVLLGAVAPVIHGFRVRHSQWAQSLGFKAIWLADPLGGTVRLV